MTIIINNEQTDFSVDESFLEKIALETLHRYGGTTDVQIGITLVDDAYIRDLNARFRNIDRSTDVLSFPLIDYTGFEEDPSLFWDDKNRSKLETDFLTGEVLLGDLVISFPTAMRNAALYGHRPERELGYLTVHGILHLLGYDHETESGRLKMRDAEETVLLSLGLPRTSVITEGLLSALQSFTLEQQETCISVFCSDDQFRSCTAKLSGITLSDLLPFLPKGVIPIVAAIACNLPVALPCPVYKLIDNEWVVFEPVSEGASHGE